MGKLDREYEADRTNGINRIHDKTTTGRAFIFTSFGTRLETLSLIVNHSFLLAFPIFKCSLIFDCMITSAFDAVPSFMMNDHTNAGIEDAMNSVAPAGAFGGRTAR